ncbi:NAD(P)/FAD-dependent oxidoreductase [uncultured Litoreibacter sp.]|uniref:NAD(P)/FAD-dependent oxidoreductase n=1 Tax=uncultured Litoreibacter sp. TaxID=1392394 RepID=UPI002621A724|nr:NAD(P)/FAD-dependent oxidoreductase [uncultured Litoreibacter sp.]
MSTVIETDILIVGGGPAGLSVSAHLSGLTSVVVHQDREIGKPVRTSGGSWLADAQRLGIPEDLYQRVDRLDVYSDTRKIALDITDAPGVVFDITNLYQWLASQATSEIHCATKFLRTEKVANGYLSTVRTAGKGEWQIKSRQIVDASGWHCTVLESLGLNTRPAREGVGIEYEYPVDDLDMNRAILFFGSFALAGYGWAFPTNYGTVRLGVGVVSAASEQSLREMMNALLASDLLKRMGIPAPEGEHVNAGTIPSVAYEKTLVYGDVVRVGDSANMATPTLGEGLRICIEQGRLLGDALSKQTPRALKAWERQANGKLALKYRVGFWVNQAATQYTPAQWERSLRRMEKLPPAELVEYFKNDFTTSMIVRRVALLVWRKLKDRVFRA